MKKILLSIAILLGISNFAHSSFINKEKDISQIQYTNEPYIYNTSYTHTWTKVYQTGIEMHNIDIADSSDTYYAGKWSYYASTWSEFTQKYNYFAFTNDSIFSIEYHNHAIEYATRKNNFWKKTNQIREYVSGKNNNVVFQISTGIIDPQEVSLSLEVWYTTGGEFYFKWNFRIKGYNLRAKISVHLPQIKYYYFQN